jgi:peptidase M23-like protein
VATPRFAAFPVTQGFGPTSEPLDSGGVNKGVDYALPPGTPVDAAVGGLVLAVGDQGDGWGISVKVRDAEGNLHNYGHLSAVNVRAGQRVSEGTILGKSGSTGKSTGPHLSYDVADARGQYIDPAPFVGGAPGGGGGAQPAYMTQRPGGVAQPRAAPMDPLDDDALGPSGAGEGEPGGGEALPPQPTDWYAEGVDAATRVNMLGKAGYVWVGQRNLLPDMKGKNAPWRAPDGSVILEHQALDIVGAAQQQQSARAAAAKATAPVPGIEGMLEQLLRAEYAKPVNGATPSASRDPDAILRIMQAQQKLADGEAKQLRLDDGTIITGKMLASADPITRQQFVAELESRQRKADKESYDLLNQYGIDYNDFAQTSYTNSRAATNDANANLNNDYRNKIEAVRQSLDLDKITIEQAGAEIDRILNGMQESRARAQLETETALKAAPFATVGGKTGLTGADLGASVSGLAGFGGIQNPENTALIQFPGTTHIDVASLMAQGDAALGVAGQPLPAIPKVQTQYGQIPTPPTFAQGPTPPQLMMPTQLPQQAPAYYSGGDPYANILMPGYVPTGYNPEEGQ